MAEIRLARFGHMIGLPLQLDFFQSLADPGQQRSGRSDICYK
jgi:hypothetical protein